MEDVATRVREAAAGFVMPRSVTAAEYEAITCNRCGCCCEDIPAPEAPEAMAAIAEDPRSDEDTRAFAGGLVAVRPIPGGWTYRCRHFSRDPDGLGACAIYDRRPSICRRFPDRVVRRWTECAWYVKVGDGSEAQEWQPVTLGKRPPATDPAAARLQALYDALAPDEREVMDVILRRAAAHIAEAAVTEEGS